MPCVVNFVVCTDKREGSEKYKKETTSKTIYLLSRRRVGLFFHSNRGLPLVAVGTR